MPIYITCQTSIVFVCHRFVQILTNIALLVYNAYDCECATTFLITRFGVSLNNVYLRDAVSTVIAMTTWLAGWLSHSGIVSKWLL